MKRFLKNKYVMLTIIIVILSIVYFGVNKAIKQYNYTNDDDIVTEEKGEEYSKEETNLVLEGDLNVDDDGDNGGNVNDDENGENDDCAPRQHHRRATLKGCLSDCGYRGATLFGHFRHQFR